jgi:hypothetical protein
MSWRVLKVIWNEVIEVAESVVVTNASAYYSMSDL